MRKYVQELFEPKPLLFKYCSSQKYCSHQQLFSNTVQLNNTVQVLFKPTRLFTSTVLFTVAIGRSCFKVHSCTESVNQSRIPRLLLQRQIGHTCNFTWHLQIMQQCHSSSASPNSSAEILANDNLISPLLSMARFVLQGTYATYLARALHSMPGL